MQRTFTTIIITFSFLSFFLSCAEEESKKKPRLSRLQQEEVTTEESQPLPCGTRTDSDTDNDGIPDQCDNCVRRYNPNQADTDQDTVGDVCDLRPENLGPAMCQNIDGLLERETYDWCQEDSDRDGIENHTDLCYWVIDDTDESGAIVDTDQDLVPDSCDRCPKKPSDDFLDFLSETQAINDTDDDGVDDSCDNCPGTPNPDQSDNDQDGIGDLCDNFPDEWGHEKCDRQTEEQLTRAESAWCGQDSDGDGVPNGGDQEPENPHVK